MCLYGLRVLVTLLQNRFANADSLALFLYLSKALK